MADDAILGIELLGGFRITVDGAAVRDSVSARLQSLVAYLALHPETPLSRQQLASLFWPDSEESQSRTNLRQLLHHLRTALPQTESRLEADQHALWWRPGPTCSVDAIDFEQAVKRGDFETAARLYRGDLLPSCYDDWIESERERLKQTYDKALDRLASEAEIRGDLADAVAFAETRLARDTLREAGYQNLMRLHGLAGDRAAVLRVYEQCAAVLHRELAVAPSAATRRIRDEFMLADDNVAVPRQAPAPNPTAPAPRVTARETPLIGREREWAELEAAWSKAARGGPQLLLVTGEPGIGKTRLLEELTDRAAQTGAATAVASCYEGARALAFTAAAAWLRTAGFCASIEDLPAVDRAELAIVLPEINAPVQLSTKSGESWRKRRLYEAIARTLVRQKSPVLLALDDAQWCDPDTIELLPYLVRFDAASRLMILVTARRDDAGPLRRALDRVAVEIEVGPLDARATVRLAGQIAGHSLEHDAAHPLYDRTKGNPLFVIETARSGSLSGGPVPARVQAVIMSRLEHLGDDAKEVAAVAAVIGRPFSAELAASVTKLPDDAVAGAIDELWKCRFLDALIDGAYDFSHGLLRDAAYESIGPARRRLLHRRVAEAFESLCIADADSASAWLASHYDKAGLPDLAIRWYHRAAQASTRRFSDEEAIAHLRKALDLVQRVPGTPERDRLELELLLAYGLSLSATQGYASEEAGRVYGRARIIGEIARDSDAYFGVLAGSSTYHIVRGDLAVSREMGERYLALAEQNGDSMLRAAGEFAVGCSVAHIGLLRQGRDLIEASLRHEAESARSRRFFDFGPELGVFSGAYGSHLKWLMGDADGALRASEDIIARAQSISHPFSLSLALAYSAMLHQFRDEPELALGQAEAVAALCRKYGFRYYLAWTPIIAGWARSRLGEIEQGLAGMRQGYAELRSTGAGLRAPYYLVLIAEACGRQGKPEEGLRELAEAGRIMESTDERWAAPAWYRVRGELLQQTRQDADAAACFRNAARLARKIGARAWEPRTASERI